MSSILSEIQQGVCFITLNRPEKLNAFNKEMALQLQSILDEANNNTSVRCILITGAGKAFSAGQDLSELTGSNPPSFSDILSQHYNPIITKIFNAQKPVIAVVNGVAAGAGANIALCCDIVVSAESATFIQAFSKIGLIPDSGGTYFLPRLIGHQKASALMLTGDAITATEAEKLGMIYKTVPDYLLQETCNELAFKIAKMPTKGLALTKMALQESLKNQLETQLAVEDNYQQIAANTYDYNEGVQSFLEKRKPNFKGY
ncbi:MAG: enoyl-CoA hydratase-related protein [Chitinophagaceae bacterium]|jgi:2-(1,2-epoxy-1,2-dihydrophenyl)acetyl-CoA isomerase